ncbi:GlgB N-terminal domain-containing protein, partial [Actinomyces denticolens]
MTDVTSPEPAPESNDAPPPQATGPAPVPVDPWALADVAYGRYHNPHEVLGAHVGDGGVTIRTVRH